MVSLTTDSHVDSNCTLGAYLNTLDALDMSLRAVDGRPEPAPAPRAPGTVRVGDYPQLKSISWSLRDDTEMTEEVAAHYARNWRYIDEGALDDDERTFIQHLGTATACGIAPLRRRRRGWRRWVRVPPGRHHGQH
jgi:hypothetical protein